MPSNFAQAPVVANHLTGDPSKLQITWQNDPITFKKINLP
jgi:hypothetical protein